MDDEINLAKKRRKSGRFISTLAKRFAAREAAMKALPLSSDQTISWQDIQIGSHSSGQPSLGFSPHIEKLLQTACPGHMKPVCHLSLSDEKNYAQAFVVIEAQTR